jgi:ClpP class serine protease
MAMLFVPSRELSKIFSSKLWMSRRAFNEVLGELFLANRSGWYEGVDIPTYKDMTKDQIKVLSQTINISLTDEYSSTQIQEDSIAFYRMQGLILAEPSWWYFSSKQFRADLLEADSNPKIIAHFVLANSGGGEAWYLDVVANTMKNLKKPVVSLYENVAASAAIYNTIYSTKIFAATPHETIGSIGTMMAFLDIIPYYETLGAKYYEHNASQSSLKNKKFNDLLDGKPEQYIKEELDPLAGHFISVVAAARPATGKLGEEHPVFKGETFDTKGSIEIGLIDGQMLLEDAIAEAYKLGVNSKSNALKLNHVFNQL